MYFAIKILKYFLLAIVILSYRKIQKVWFLGENDKGYYGSLNNLIGFIVINNKPFF